MIDHWKNRGTAAATGPAGEARPSPTGAARSSTDYQERLKTLNAADFGDLLLECIRCSARTRRAGPVSTALQVHAGRRVPGHQCRPVPVATAACAEAASGGRTQQLAPSPSPLVGEGGERSEPGEGPVSQRRRPLRRPRANRLSGTLSHKGRGCSARGKHGADTQRRRTSAASATTTSRSTAGAAPRSTTSCASRRTSPAPR